MVGMRSTASQTLRVGTPRYGVRGGRTTRCLCYLLLNFHACLGVLGVLAVYINFSVSSRWIKVRSRKLGR
jgi:hypothetical protein